MTVNLIVTKCIISISAILLLSCTSYVDGSYCYPRWPSNSDGVFCGFDETCCGVNNDMCCKSDPFEPFNKPTVKPKEEGGIDFTMKVVGVIVVIVFIMICICVCGSQSKQQITYGSPNANDALIRPQGESIQQSAPTQPYSPPQASYPSNPPSYPQATSAPYPTQGTQPPYPQQTYNPMQNTFPSQAPYPPPTSQNPPYPTSPYPPQSNPLPYPVQANISQPPYPSQTPYPPQAPYSAQAPYPTPKQGAYPSQDPNTDRTPAFNPYFNNQATGAPSVPSMPPPYPPQ